MQNTIPLDLATNRDSLFGDITSFLEDIPQDLLFEQGETIGKFQISSEPLPGGMSVVYIAKDLDHGREVALKFLLDADSKHIRNEVQALARVVHPNVAKFYEYYRGETRKSTGEQVRDFFAQERVRGMRLSDAIKENLTPVQTYFILQDVIKGLQAVHNNMFVHGDLKPTNVMIQDPSGTSETDRGVMILDFGIAQKIGEGRMNGSNTIAGTPQYASPEQLRGERLDASSDVYSLGMTGFEMLTGNVPRDGSAQTILLNVQDGLQTEKPFPRVPFHRWMTNDGYCQRKLSEILDRCRSNDRPNLAEILTDLQKSYPRFVNIRRAMGILLTTAAIGGAVGIPLVSSYEREREQARQERRYEIEEITPRKLNEAQDLTEKGVLLVNSGDPEGGNSVCKDSLDLLEEIKLANPYQETQVDRGQWDALWCQSRAAFHMGNFDGAREMIPDESLVPPEEEVYHASLQLWLNEQPRAARGLLEDVWYSKADLRAGRLLVRLGIMSAEDSSSSYEDKGLEETQKILDSLIRKIRDDIQEKDVLSGDEHAYLGQALLDDASRLRLLGEPAFLEDALERVDAAKRIFQNRDNSRMYAIALTHEGLLLHDSGDLPSAKAALERAERIHTKLGAKGPLAKTQQTLGAILQAEHEVDAALEKLVSSYGTFREAGNQREMLNSLYNLHLTKLTLGHSREVAVSAKKAAELARNTNHRYLAGLIESTRVMAAMQMDEVEMSRESYSRMISDLGQHMDIFGTYAALIHAQTLAKRGLREEARDVLELARGMPGSDEYNMHIARAVQKRLDPSLDISGIREEIGEGWGEASLLVLMADASSPEDFSRAITFADSLGDIYRSLEARLLASRVIPRYLPEVIDACQGDLPLAYGPSYRTNDFSGLCTRAEQLLNMQMNSE